MSKPMFRPRMALPTRRTAIEEWPREWLEFIEPKIERGPIEEGDHWFWTGYTMGGAPRLVFLGPDRKQKRVVVSNFIVSIFWYIHADLMNADAGNYDGFKPWFVKQSCQYKNCVNPQHLVPRARNGFGDVDDG